MADRADDSYMTSLFTHGVHRDGLQVYRTMKVISARSFAGVIAAIDFYGYIGPVKAWFEPATVDIVRRQPT